MLTTVDDVKAHIAGISLDPDAAYTFGAWRATRRLTTLDLLAAALDATPAEICSAEGVTHCFVYTGFGIVIRPDGQFQVEAFNTVQVNPDLGELELVCFDEIINPEVVETQKRTGTIEYPRLNAWMDGTA